MSLNPALEEAAIPGEFDITLGRSSPLQCFPAHTAILSTEGVSRPISALSLGDIVFAFSPTADHGRGALVPARVTRLYYNITDEWLVVRPAPDSEAIATANGFSELTVTPGHETLDAQGRFRPIIDILNDDARLVLADGSVVSVVYERVMYSAATAHLYEQAEIAVARSAGNLALKPEVKRGGATYNFEVEGLHTYVAGRASRERHAGVRLS